MQARTEKLSLWFKSFPNGHQAECFGIVNPSRRISENKIMSANFLFMILLGTYMLYARPVTIPVPNLTQIIFQYTSRLKNDQTAGTKYFISTAIWRNMGWKIRVTKWQIQMILTQKVIFGCPSFLISWNIWVTWNRTCLTAGTASLWVHSNYRGKSEGGARGRNPDASHCASSPNISSSAKAGDLFPGGHDPLEHCPKRCFKVQGMDVRISSFGLSLMSRYVWIYISEHIL